MRPLIAPSSDCTGSADMLDSMLHINSVAACFRPKYDAAFGESKDPKPSTINATTEPKFHQDGSFFQVGREL